MIRLAPYLIGAAVILGVFYAGQRYATQDQREQKLEREKEIGDAIKDTDAAPSWRDILLGRE